MDLLVLYLDFMLVEYEGQIFKQKQGVCTGSCLAPLLSEFSALY